MFTVSHVAAYYRLNYFLIKHVTAGKIPGKFVLRIIVNFVLFFLKYSQRFANGEKHGRISMDLSDVE